MSKIALSPNASGSGTVTITAPNTNTNRTIALPDVAGNVVTTGDTGTVVAGMIGSGAVTTAKIGSGAVEYAKLDQTLGTWNKLTDVSVATNTAPQMMFHSILNGPYQYYKVIGKIGGSVSVANANISLSWVTGTGTDLSARNYYRSNTGFLSDGNANVGYGNGHTQAYIVAATATGISNFVDMTLIPSLAYGFGHIHTHDQNTHIGVTTFGFKYNAGFSDISGIKVYPSGGNITEVDLTVYGMKTSGSLGG